jgi:hypothetical protein
MLPTPGPEVVSIDSDNHSVVPKPQDANVPPGQTIFLSGPQPSLPSATTVTVTITATIGAMTATAELVISGR